MSDKTCEDCGKAYTKVKAQRDQLLEALEDIAERTKDVSRSSHKIAVEAISSVKGEICEQ